ncbi:MAG: ABC transporter permease [Anaerolineaceae bacterium]|nr:ABC transporter permease [Anaerolineaceae bacterium]
MLQIFKMAFRDLLRNKRRTIFSALALAMGLAILLFMAAFINGELISSRESTIRLSSGHLQVRAKEYNQNRNSLLWEDLIENPMELAAQVSALEVVETATPRLFASGLIFIGDKSEGVRVMGVDPDSSANAPYRDGLLEGEFLQADDRGGILIGKPLAEKFDLQVGDDFAMLVNTSNGDVDEQRFIIRGIYSTNTTSLDKAVVLMPLNKTQAITQTDNHASILFVLLKDIEQTDAVAAALQTSQYKVATWVEMNELLSLIDEVYESFIYILYLIVLGITATVVINTLIMSVYERTREIGILSAIGMNSRRIMVLFFAESGMIAVIGIFLGLIIGGIMVAYATKYGFYFGDLGTTGMILGDVIYAKLKPDDAITLTIMAFFVTLAAGVYPAIMAAKMEPVEALRGGKA